jgi:hypothetical protein
VTLGVGRELSCAVHDHIDVPRRNRPFLDQSVGKYGGPPVEKVEDPVIDAPKPNPQLINSISQVICLRATEFMTQLLEPLYPYQTFRLGLVTQAIKPIQHRSDAIVILEKSDLGLGHFSSLTYSYVRIFANKSQAHGP